MSGERELAGIDEDRAAQLEADTRIREAIARGGNPSREDLAGCSPTMAKTLVKENIIFFQVPKRQETSDEDAVLRARRAMAELIEEMRPKYQEHADFLSRQVMPLLGGGQGAAAVAIGEMMATIHEVGAVELGGFYQHALDIANQVSTIGQRPPVPLDEAAFITGRLVPVLRDTVFAVNNTGRTIAAGELDEMTTVVCVAPSCGATVTYPTACVTMPTGWSDGGGIGVLCPKCYAAARIHHVDHKARHRTSCGLLLGKIPDAQCGVATSGLSWTVYPSRATCSSCREELGLCSSREEPPAPLAQHEQTLANLRENFRNFNNWDEQELVDDIGQRAAHVRDALEDMADLGEIEEDDQGDDGTKWERVEAQPVNMANVNQLREEPAAGHISIAALKLAIMSIFDDVGSSCELNGSAIETHLCEKLNVSEAMINSADVGFALHRLVKDGQLIKTYSDTWKSLTKPRRFERYADLRDALWLALGGKVRVTVRDGAATWETVAPSAEEKAAQRLRLVRDACSWVLDRIGGST